VLSLSPIKILIVLVVAMILLGPDKVPQVARQIGGAWRAFRSFHERVEHEVRQNMPDLPSTHEIARIARSPVAFLNKMADLSPTLDPAVPDPGAAAASNGEAWPADPSAAAATPDTSSGATAHLASPPPGPLPDEAAARPDPAPSGPSPHRRPTSAADEPVALRTPGPVTSGVPSVSEDPSMN
jgi:sec-independent protein translocase protein TatB